MTIFECIDEEHGVWACQNCGSLYYLEADGPKENEFDFCPHCAEMIEQEAEDDA